MASPHSHTPPPVDIDAHLPVLIVWSTFNIAAAVLNLLLALLSLRVPRIRNNLLLLNLEFIFFLTCGGSSMLVWTGHARDPIPPAGVCILNASMTYAGVAAQAAAAFGLVVKVWTTAMSVYYPGSRWLEMIGSTPVLFSFTYLSAIPLFLAALNRSLRDHSLASRSSPLYCSIDDPPLGFTSSIIGAVLTLLALVFAGWTATFVARSRWRVRSMRSGRHTNYALIVRTLLFSVFVFVAFVGGAMSLISGFNAIVPDVVISTTGLGAFFIFASDRDILRMLKLRAVADAHTPKLSALSFASRSHTRSHTRHGSPSPRGAELVTLGGGAAHGGPPAVAVSVTKSTHVDLGGDEDVFRGAPKERRGSPDEGDVGFWKGEPEEPSDDESTDKRSGGAVV